MENHIHKRLTKMDGILQLSADACPNNWLPKTLKSVQLHPNITEICPAMVAFCYSNIGPQYKKIRFVSSQY